MRTFKSVLFFQSVFEACVGYPKLSAALQSCGQPDKDLLAIMLDWVSHGFC